MGIPIKKYIDISTAVLDREGSNYDTSALMFVSTSMKESAPEEKANDFVTGKILKFSSADDVAKCWSDSVSVVEFANKYFGTTANGRSPNTLYVVNSIVTFDDLVEKFDNFGSFCKENFSFDSDIAAANMSLGRKYVYLYSTTSSASSGKIRGGHEMHVNSGFETDIAVVAAWIATRDYDGANSLGTIDYTEFSQVGASVDDGDTKDTLDEQNINYVGKVQIRGLERSFYQPGVNSDGEDLGVYCDSCWIQSEIEAGWINLALGATKIPFNDFGAMRVRSMIIDVAERALYNGAILVGKPLTDTQIQEINLFAGTEDASTSVQTNGYYVSTRLLPDKVDGKFVCQYTLIYGKGDHIQKIKGSHLLA